MGSTLQRPLVGAGSMRSAVGTTVSVEGLQLDRQCGVPVTGGGTQRKIGREGA